MIDPTELTFDMVESLIDDEISLDPNIQRDYLLGHQISLWKRTKGKDRIAARAICEEYNARMRDRHALAEGAACREGDDGMCAGCGVEMTVCNVCHGIGYHRENCSAEALETNG